MILTQLLLGPHVLPYPSGQVRSVRVEFESNYVLVWNAGSADGSIIEARKVVVMPSMTVYDPARGTKGVDL